MWIYSMVYASYRSVIDLPEIITPGLLRRTITIDDDEHPSNSLSY